MSGLDNSAKTSYQLWKSALNPEMWAENSKNFNEIGDLFDPENVKQMLAMCACRV